LSSKFDGSMVDSQNRLHRRILFDILFVFNLTHH